MSVEDRRGCEEKKKMEIETVIMNCQRGDRETETERARARARANERDRERTNETESERTRQRTNETESERTRQRARQSETESKRANVCVKTDFGKWRQLIQNKEETRDPEEETRDQEEEQDTSALLNNVFVNI